MLPRVSLAGEGPLDIVIMRRLLAEVGLSPGPVYSGEGRNKGKSRIDARLSGFIAAARHGPWFVLRDLDHDAVCAADLVGGLVATKPERLCFRVAVREAEAWLIADHDNLIRFLGLSDSALRGNPEGFDDPKRAILDAVAKSRRKGVRAGMLPRPDSGLSVGPEYTTILRDFVRGPWDPRKAEAASDSLLRAFRNLEALRALLASEFRDQG